MKLAESGDRPFAPVFRGQLASARDIAAVGPRAGQGRAAASVLGEIASIEKHLRAPRRTVCELSPKRLVRGVRFDVDRTSLAFADDLVAVGVEVAPRERDSERTEDVVGHAVDIHRPSGATLRRQTNIPMSRFFGENVDHAAERIVSPHPGAAPPHDLDPIDRLERNPAPVDPATEGIVERHAVEKDERTARGGGPHAAERDSLRRRSRRKARRAAEEAEARDLPQKVVECLRRRALEILPREDRHVGRDIAPLLLDPVGSDDDGVHVEGAPRRRQAAV